MNEWQLQGALTEQWLRTGIPLAQGAVFLATWKVKFPSWRINDASSFSTEPSIDFLGIDGDGKLVAVELKVTVPGRLPAWRALCQVTHRAALVAETFSIDALEQAYSASRHGKRVHMANRETPSVKSAASDFFGWHVSPNLDAVRRVVAATRFGPQWPQVLYEFNSLPWSALIRRLGELGLDDGRGTNREIARLHDLELPIAATLDPVEYLTVEQA